MFLKRFAGVALDAAVGTGHHQRSSCRIGNADGRMILVGRHIEQFLEHQRLDRKAALRLLDEENGDVETAIVQPFAQQPAVAIDEMQQDLRIGAAEPHEQFASE